MYRFNLDSQSSVSIDRSTIAQVKTKISESGISIDLASPEESDSYIIFIAWLDQLNQHMRELLPTEPLASHSSLPGNQKAQDYFKYPVLKLFAKYVCVNNQELYEFLEQMVQSYSLSWTHEIRYTTKEKQLAKELLNKLRFSPFMNIDNLNRIFHHDVFSNPLSVFIGQLAYIAEGSAEV